MSKWLGVAILFICTFGAVQANEALLGRWRGTFNCDGDRGVTMELTISTVKDGRLEGVFEYQSRRGSYNVSGTVTPSGTFALDPGNWNKRPSGFQAKGLRGNLERFGERDMLRGTFVACKAAIF